MTSATHTIQPAQASADISEDELVQVITDFLAMGHVDNIVAMFRQEPRYYQLTGRLVNDSRYAVRLGISVLFEQLCILDPAAVSLAVGPLAEQLNNSQAWIRGEAASILAIIGTEEAFLLIRALLSDPSRQVVEIIHDILGLPQDG